MGNHRQFLIDLCKSLRRSEQLDRYFSKLTKAWLGVSGLARILNEVSGELGAQATGKCGAEDGINAVKLLRACGGCLGARRR